MENNAAKEADDMDALEAVETRIGESILSVMVRDGWRSPGAGIVPNDPEKFEILLTTGGPALRIYGRLDNGYPADPILQWQDWGTPWTDYWPANAADIPYKATLQTFAMQFYFGD